MAFLPIVCLLLKHVHVTYFYVSHLDASYPYSSLMFAANDVFSSLVKVQVAKMPNFGSTPIGFQLRWWIVAIPVRNGKNFYVDSTSFRCDRRRIDIHRI